jgi:hypothetical protein
MDGWRDGEKSRWAPGGGARDKLIGRSAVRQVLGNLRFLLLCRSFAF